MIDSLHKKWVARIGNELVLDFTSPVQSLSKGAHNGARNVLSVFPDFFRTRAQNIALKKRVGELEQQVVALREDLRQERRLRDLLGYAENFQEEKIFARVVGNDPSSWFRTIIIDKGTVHGVRPYLPVISASGLAGHVVEVFRFSSKVLLLTDPNSKVSVIAQQGRVQGVVQGDGASQCLLKYIEPTAHIKTGDVLITSGYSRIYPKGLLVGSVTDIKNTPGSLFQWARLMPYTDFKKLEEVVVLVPPPVQEPAPAAGYLQPQDAPVPRTGGT